jgi:hypothetical protein
VPNDSPGETSEWEKILEDAEKRGTTEYDRSSTYRDFELPDKSHDPEEGLKGSGDHQSLSGGSSSGGGGGSPFTWKPGATDLPDKRPDKRAADKPGHH